MERLTVNSSPHIKNSITTPKLMGNVCISLIPAGIASVVIFGHRALLLILVSVASCMLFEYICCKIMKKENTLYDLSAVVTGLLLAYTYPASLDWWIGVIGSFIAIVVVKEMFGGLGQNFVNPAITARVALLISFPAQMTDWSIESPLAAINQSPSIDVVTTATPLSAPPSEFSLIELFFGLRGGSLGETCILALLVGGIYLVARKIITPVIPVSFILTTMIGYFISGGDVLYNIMAGGLVLGAVFMATDYVTSPVTLPGQLIYGIGCGLLTLLLRSGDGMPEGVSYAILIMNILTPLIDRYVRPRPFGTVKSEKEVK